MLMFIIKERWVSFERIYEVIVVLKPKKANTTSITMILFLYV